MAREILEAAADRVDVIHAGMIPYVAMAHSTPGMRDVIEAVLERVVRSVGVLIGGGTS